MLKRWIVAQHSCQKWISPATGVETRSVQAYRLVPCLSAPDYNSCISEPFYWGYPIVCYAVNFEKLEKRKSISMGFSNQCFFKQQTCCWVSVKFLSHDSFFLKKWLPDPNLFRDLRPTRKGNFLLIRRKFHKPIIPFGCTFGIEDYLNFLPRSTSSLGGS